MVTPTPAGPLTFLCTDIEGSTARWEHQHDAMSAALVLHDAIVRGAIEAYGGQVFKTVGDAFYAVFPGAIEALSAALAAQQGLVAENWSTFGPDFTGLRVRIGIHHGQAEERGGDYLGPALNRAARLMSAAHGGQVLLSHTAHEAARDHLPPGVALRDLGEHRLKDLRHIEHIWQVVAHDLPDVTRSLVTAGELGARDRLVVSDPSAPGFDATEEPTVVARSVGETLAELHSVVLRDTTSVVLTAEQVRQAARHRPADLTEYRLGRIAEWSQPRYRLDGRFVDLTLLVDQDEEVVGDRWVAKSERYDDLGALLAAVPEPAVVVLGPPGSGKTTLLRHLELDKAIAALRGKDAADSVTFFAPLNQYSLPVGQADVDPGDWLSERWATAHPDLRPLNDLLAEGRAILLLDALNELPSASEREFRERVGWWKDWLVRLAKDRPGNRVVFSCRTLDYSAPLSTPALRVPQVQIEALDDNQVREFLHLSSPLRGEAIWSAIAGTPLMETLRLPFLLALLAEQVETTGELIDDRARLFTGFVRQALKREAERGSPLFALEELLTSRDIQRIAEWRWRDPYDLPEGGALIPKLSALAYGMQATVVHGEQGQVRVNYDTALELVDDPHDADIVRAGVAIGMLDEDPVADEVLFRHQLLQEYFAARVLAREPRPELVAASWRIADIKPGLREILETLPAAETLPALPVTDWDETMMVAVAMVGEPEPILRAVMAYNLVVAARAAQVPGVRARLSPPFLDELRWALVARSRDREADLRHRIACGYAVGDLGDPRWERWMGPHGEYLVPPMVAIRSGAYPIGDDKPIEWTGGRSTAEVPRSAGEIASFRIGQYPVTNAEFACFLAAGGYEEQRWWDTAAGRDWRRGTGTAAGMHRGVRNSLAKYRADGDLLDIHRDQGILDDGTYERWQRRLAMTEAEFTEHLHELYPEQRYTEPRYWQDERYNRLAQPVVGICWHEARAFCAWLSAQAGAAFRLPTEAEWEATTRDRDGRVHAHGDGFDPLQANMVATRVKRPTPVGVFIEGDTPEGVSDLTGNVYDWTSSLCGAKDDEPGSAQPSWAVDGREDLGAGDSVLCMSRGGAWNNVGAPASAVSRVRLVPGYRDKGVGFRVTIPDTRPCDC